MRAPYYRIVVADARTKRDGRVIETIGKYHPKEEPCFIEVDSDRAQYWLGVGAQPTDPVTAILKVTGDWQKFKGEAAPPPMRVAEPRRDKAEVFQEASRAAAGLGESSGGPATQPRKRKGSEKANENADTPGSPPEQPAVAPAAAGEATASAPAAATE
jgi:small subunit ribosomal protein S16